VARDDDSNDDAGKLERRYRSIDTRIWADRRFRRLSKPQPNAQDLFVRLLLGSQVTSLPGLQHIGKAALAEQLEWSVEQFLEQFAELSREGLAKADWDARVVWVPNAIRYNVPKNPNVVTGWRSHWLEVPECDLKDEAYLRLRGFLNGAEQQVKPTLLQAFIDGCGNGYENRLANSSGNGSPNGMPNQEQDQEQDQEQEREPRARPLTAANSQPGADGEPTEPWAVLWRRWELVAYNGESGGSPAAHRDRLGAAWRTCLAREPADPAGAFERAARACVADLKRNGKRSSLAILCSQLGDWLAPQPTGAKGPAAPSAFAPPDHNTPVLQDF
jgi:hypothetical protein